MMNTAALIERASVLADLMTLSEEMGAVARIEDDGVYLVGPDDAKPRRLGATVPEAARRLRALCGAYGTLGPRAVRS